MYVLREPGILGLHLVYLNFSSCQQESANPAPLSAASGCETASEESFLPLGDNDNRQGLHGPIFPFLADHGYPHPFGQVSQRSLGKELNRGVGAYDGLECPFLGADGQGVPLNPFNCAGSARESPAAGPPKGAPPKGASLTLTRRLAQVLLACPSRCKSLAKPRELLLAQVPGSKSLAKLLDVLLAQIARLDPLA